ncbi:MAG: YoaK family protein [Nitritalea sp.]
MLRKFSSARSLTDNIQLGALTAFAAGMVNVASLIIFFAFTSNVTGTWAILAEEISKANWGQVLIVGTWLFLFFYGNFVSNYCVISIKKSNYLSHAIPLILEILCVVGVGIYGIYYYGETLRETEILVGVLLFAMGIQNGLVATISNGAVKTTHLTGLTTDMGILVSMLTKKEYREQEAVVNKFKLLSSILVGYMAGGVFSGYLYWNIGFSVFFVTAIFLLFVLSYDFIKFRLRFMRRKAEMPAPAQSAYRTQ